MHASSVGRSWSLLVITGSCFYLVGERAVRCGAVLPIDTVAPRVCAIAFRRRIKVGLHLFLLKKKGVGSRTNSAGN
jgi:hypothetical protein